MPDCDRPVLSRHPLRLLVTGFGAFPGMPRNPSVAVLGALRRYRATFTRRHVDLRLQVLAVSYEACAAFAPEPVPDVIVHIGVAGGRQAVSLEMRAHHRRSPRHPDASGRAPTILRSGDVPHHAIDARWRAHLLAVRLRQAGVPTAVSRNAGAYVCNALLYRSLDRQDAPALFIHIPRARVCPPERIARGLARTLPDVVARLGRAGDRT